MKKTSTGIFCEGNIEINYELNRAANRQHYNLAMLNYETQLTRSNRKRFGICIGTDSVSLIVNNAAWRC